MTDPLQEDRGLIEIHRACVQMSAIWRPTPSHDLGVDGQIEFLEPGTSVSTGHIIAVQSKSGPSFFKNQDDNFVSYYPAEKHRRYWSRLKIPVILVLHNPDENLTIYTSVKPQLAGTGPILVNRNKILNGSSRESLIGSPDHNLLLPSPAEILDKFKRIELERDDNKTLTGIDFLLACTNKTGRYFEIRMRRISSLFALLSEDDGYTTSQEDYDYILRNVMLIHSNKLAEDFLDEFEEMWFGLHTVPDIASPFTNVGDDVIDNLWSNLDNYVSLESYS
ncbi:MAG: DUF4365 domain-containing protein [Thermodesulfovibrionales bacterium]